MTFGDEFDVDGRPDRSAWATCYWWARRGCTNDSNDELQWYVREGPAVDDGVLRLTADRVPTRSSDGRTFEFRSSMVSGMHREGPRNTFTFGYVEIRARAPVGRGLLPALWLLPASEDSKPEIDLLEIIGSAPDEALLHVHWNDEGGRERSRGASTPIAGGGQAWHTYGLMWRADRIEWYVDDDLRWSVARPDVDVPDEPMYVLATLAVGGDYPGPPDASTPMPAVFELDYVRIWQQS